MFQHDKFEEGNNLIEDSSVENQSLFNDIIVDLLKRKITKENSLKNKIESNKDNYLKKSIQQKQIQIKMNLKYTKVITLNQIITMKIIIISKKQSLMQ